MTFHTTSFRRWLHLLKLVTVVGCDKNPTESGNPDVGESRIDYMDVDDSAEVLIIHGPFTAGTPVVLINGMDLEVLTAQSTRGRIVAKLPRTGSMSCGDVTVRIEGQVFGPRRLYAWNGTVDTYVNTTSSSALAGVAVRIRADIGPRPLAPRSLANRNITVTGWNIVGKEQQGGCFHDYSVISRPPIPWRDADDSAGAATGVGFAAEFAAQGGSTVNAALFWGWITVKDAVRVKYDPQCSSGETVIGGFSVSIVGKYSSIDPVSKTISSGTAITGGGLFRSEWSQFICENP